MPKNQSAMVISQGEIMGVFPAVHLAIAYAAGISVVEYNDKIRPEENEFGVYLVTKENFKSVNRVLLTDDNDPLTNGEWTSIELAFQIAYVDGNIVRITDQVSEEYDD